MDKQQSAIVKQIRNPRNWEYARIQYTGNVEKSVAVLELKGHKLIGIEAFFDHALSVVNDIQANETNLVDVVLKVSKVKKDGSRDAQSVFLVVEHEGILQALTAEKILINNRPQVFLWEGLVKAIREGEVMSGSTIVIPAAETVSVFQAVGNDASRFEKTSAAMSRGIASIRNKEFHKPVIFVPSRCA